MTLGRSEESVVTTDATVNEVRVVGRVAADLEERELPSGDRVVTLRLVVPLSGPRRSPNSPTVDTIEVACWSAATRRSALRLKENGHVLVEGALRRRFFRTGVSVQSRYEVEATVVRRVAAARAGATTPRAAPSGESRAGTAGKGADALGRAP